MSVLRRLPCDGTFNQLKPLEGLSSHSHLFSFDLSAATDRFPLLFQHDIVRRLFGFAIARAWVLFGVVSNRFLAPEGLKGKAKSYRVVRFATGQPIGYLSSWPLFALSHHFVLWIAAEEAYPGRYFKA